jgi:7-cyano-7-deazaguanine synthase in queuosine biosynthesis
MERRLIFFSGGLDSTALLTLSKPDDIIVCIVDTVDNKVATSFDDVVKDKVLKIAKYFDRFVYFNPVHIPAVEIESGAGVHQTNVMFSIANNWAHIKTESLKEVWWGVYDSEYNNNVVVKKLRDDWFKAWNILHPNIKFHNPLGHLTKRDCWEMIPEKVRPLVSCCRISPPQDWKTCECMKCVQQRRAITPGAYDGAWKRFKLETGPLKDTWIIYDPSAESDRVYYQKG